MGEIGTFLGKKGELDAVVTLLADLHGFGQGSQAGEDGLRMVGDHVLADLKIEQNKEPLVD